MNRKASLEIRKTVRQARPGPSLILFLFASLLLLQPGGNALAFDYGQTGGGSISGQLTVTAVDGGDGLALEDAWVLVGPEPGNPFSGNYAQTDASGEVVFLDPALSGAQTVTVAKEGYRHFTLVSVDAAEITIPLEAFSVYDPLNPPAEEGDWVEGTISSFGVTNCNEQLEVGVVRDLLDVEWMMDFDIRNLFGPVVVETFDYPGGDYDLPRNLYLPNQKDGPVDFLCNLNVAGSYGIFERSPYGVRLPTEANQNLFCLRGVILVDSILGILSTGSIGALLGAMTYQNFGISGDFWVPAGGMTKNFGLTHSITSGPTLTMAVNDLPLAVGDWLPGWTRQVLLFGLADVSGGDGTGGLAPLNIVLQSANGSYGVKVPSQTGLLAGATYLGMGVASAFDANDDPQPREGLSAYLNRQTLTPPTTVNLDGYFDFITYTGLDVNNGRILLFYFADAERPGVSPAVDYKNCDLDVVATVDCDPTVEDCPVGREREYRNTNWTVLVPGSQGYFYLPILPPEMPKALGLPDDAAGLTYDLDWKISEYGLTNGAAFDYDAFSFNTFRDRVTHVSQLSILINVNNRVPDPPVNQSPGNGALGVAVEPTLQGSAFSDQDAASTHDASQWQVRSDAGSYSPPLFDSGEDATNLTSIQLAPGVLDSAQRYYWQVRYRDDEGAWSEYSDETWFQTGEGVQPVDLTPIYMLLL